MSKSNSYELISKKLAERIKRRRKQLGMTQEDMIDHGFNYRAYQRLESGKQNPTLQTLVRVSIALKISISKLFE